MDILSLEMSAGGYGHILVNQISSGYPNQQSVNQNQSQVLIWQFHLSLWLPSSPSQSRSLVSLLRSCVPFVVLIIRGLLLITPWAMECQKDLIKLTFICLVLLRTIRSPIGSPTYLPWSMHITLHAPLHN